MQKQPLRLKKLEEPQLPFLGPVHVKHKQIPMFFVKFSHFLVFIPDLS